MSQLLLLLVLVMIEEEIFGQWLGGSCDAVVFILLLQIV